MHGGASAAVGLGRQGERQGPRGPPQHPPPPPPEAGPGPTRTGTWGLAAARSFSLASARRLCVRRPDQGRRSGTEQRGLQARRLQSPRAHPLWRLACSTIKDQLQILGRRRTRCEPSTGPCGCCCRPTRRRAGGSAGVAVGERPFLGQAPQRPGGSCSSRNGSRSSLSGFVQGKRHLT